MGVKFIPLENRKCMARGYHSHRLYSHSCNHRSKLWPALFGVWLLTTLIFWALTALNFNRWP